MHLLLLYTEVLIDVVPAYRADDKKLGTFTCVSSLGFS